MLRWVKVFALGERWGMLNLNIDYLHSTRDRRDKLKTNANIALNATWTHTISRALAWENTLSADFSKNVDGLKSDPDATLNRTRTDQQNLRLACVVRFRPSKTHLSTASTITFRSPCRTNTTCTKSLLPITD